MDEALTISYSESNQYFPNTDNVLTTLGCVNPLDIDTYIKRSFSASYQAITLNGALVEAFTKDHLVDDRFVIYQIIPTPALSNQGMVTYTPMKKWYFSWSFVAGVIQGTPLIALLFLSLLSLILPASVAKILRDISIIGLVITYLYYAYKMLRVLYKTITNKGIDYHGVNVVCDVPSDLTKINDATVDHIQTLFTSSMVTKVISYHGAWYVKQSTGKVKVSSTIFAIFKPQASVDIELPPMVQSITPALMALAFISSTPTTNAQ